MSHNQKTSHRHALAALLACAVLAGAAGLAFAYDPTPTLRNLYNAPYAVLTILEVTADNEAGLLDAMVKEGAYNKLMIGFANERILQPLPTAEGHARFFCVARYYDKGTADYVESHRLAMVRPLLARDPVRLDVTLIEHLLADWGWERGTPQSTVSAKAFQNDEVFEENLTSLSFFKAGYVGQVGMLEFFPKSAKLEQIRAAVAARIGVSGASIFQQDGSERYVVYSEFFKAPKDSQAQQFVLAAGKPVAGAQAGVVVQNYMAR